MENHGNKQIWAAGISCLTFTYLLLIGLAFNSAAQSYIVNTYVPHDDSSLEFMKVKTVVIDLDEKVIVDGAILADSGTILNKTPIAVSNNRGTFLLSFWANGMMAKNSGFGAGIPNLHYALFLNQNGSLRFLRKDEIPAANISLLSKIPSENGFRLGIVSDTGDAVILGPGIYGINSNDRFEFRREVPVNEIPGSIGNLGGFALLQKIWRAEAYHLYHSFHTSQYWLVKLNNENSTIVDSLQLRQSGGQATIYAYHPGRDRFYCFHLNYEIHGQYTHKYRDDYYVEPDVSIYDPVSLELSEQYPVTDYPEGEYPGRENGLAEVVGDFIVYYFFEDDWMGRFNPAMLFIFDTRTNEASWLRVGWR